MPKFDIDIWKERREGTEPSDKKGPSNVLAGFYFRPVDREAVGRAYRDEVQSTGVGDNSNAQGRSSVALGPLAEAIDDTTVAIGPSARATVAQSTVVGEQSQGLKYRSTIVGRKSVSKGLSGIVVGSNSAALHDDSLVIGNDLFTTEAEEILIGGRIRVDSTGTLFIDGAPVAMTVNTLTDQGLGSIAFGSLGTTYTSVVTATAAATTLLVLSITSNLTNAANLTAILVDVGVDPAGGTSYTEIVRDIRVLSNSGNNAQGSVALSIPFAIGVGSRIGVRATGTADGGQIDIAVSTYRRV
jgi:hypothetical protein